MPPIPKKETWIVGWIQACSHMEFYNQYGEQGMSSWELPDLQEGKIEAISDSDGVNYPWYGNTTETCTIVGPTKRDSRFIISMNDNFYPSVTWAVPVSESNVAKLTNIYRDQSFHMAGGHQHVHQRHDHPADAALAHAAQHRREPHAASGPARTAAGAHGAGPAQDPEQE